MKCRAGVALCRRVSPSFEELCSACHRPRADSQNIDFENRRTLAVRVKVSFRARKNRAKILHISTIFFPRKKERKIPQDGVLSVSSGDEGRIIGNDDDDDAKLAFVFFSFSEEEEGLERREQSRREHREEETSSRDSRGAIIDT